MKKIILFALIICALQSNAQVQKIFGNSAFDVNTFQFSFVNGLDTLMKVQPTVIEIYKTVDMNGNWLKFSEDLQTEVTSTTTATKFSTLPVNTTGGAVTVNPPGTPLAEDWFAVSDSRGQASANNITVDFTTAGQKLHGATSNYTMISTREYVKFVYVNSTVGWIKGN